MGRAPPDGTPPNPSNCHLPPERGSELIRVLRLRLYLIASVGRHREGHRGVPQQGRERSTVPAVVHAEVGDRVTRSCIRDRTPALRASLPKAWVTLSG